jgi:phospholipase C
VFYQPDPANPDGYLLPFHLDSRTTAARATPSTGHGWPVQHAALNGGAMDSWVTAHTEYDGASVGPFTMGYYQRQDIPFHFAPADAFTVFDNYDEGDGLFDHVVPPLPPTGTPDEFVTLTSPAAPLATACRSARATGCRASSSRRGRSAATCSARRRTTTSVLRFLEQLTGVQESNISAWRRQTFGDFTDIFGALPARTDFPALPDTSGPLTLATYETTQFQLPAFPGARQTFLVQERGHRPSLG